MTRTMMVKKLASASKQIEKVHLAARQGDGCLGMVTEDKRLDMLQRLTEARMNLSLAINRLENPY